MSGNLNPETRNMHEDVGTPEIGGNVYVEDMETTMGRLRRDAIVQKVVGNLLTM